jgi:cytochrome P450
LLDASQAGTWESPDKEFLTDQTFSLVFAGIDTSSIAMTSAFYHIITSPDVLQRLQHELRGAAPDIQHVYDWKKVRQLPYLVSGCC